MGLRRRAPRRLRPRRLRREHLGVRARPAAHRRRALRRLLGLARPGPPARRRRQRAGRPGRPAHRVRRPAARRDRPAHRHPPARRTGSAALDDAVALADRRRRRSDGWQSGQVQRELGRVRRAAADLGQVDLRLPDVRALLSDRLAGRPTRANFRTGTLTVCTMVPMRSVPHRVVCLLGLDDGVFPRQGAVDGDDVLARDPMTGERDARSEDRQLLLDAILAATQTLVVTYTGANEVSGRPRPPAVPLGRGARRPRRDRDHRRRPAGLGGRHGPPPAAALRRARTSRPAALRPRRDVLLRRRRCAREPGPPPGPRTPPVPFLDAPLPPAPPGDVSLADLVRFWGDPVKGFLGPRRRRRRPRRRRGPARGRPAGRDRQPGPVGGRRPRARRPAGGPRPGRRQAARVAARRATTRAARLADARPDPRPRRSAAGGRGGAAHRRRRARSTSRSTSAAAAGCVGTVPEVYGDRLVPVTLLPARRQAPPRVVGPAARPRGVRRGPQLDRPHHRPAPQPLARRHRATSLLGPARPHRRSSVLRDLVALRDHGLRAPLPLPLKASLRLRPGPPYPRRRARRAGEGGLRLEGRQVPRRAVRAGGPDDLGPARGAARGGGAPGPGEEFPGETGRFGALALRVWSPLIEAEQGSW